MSINDPKQRYDAIKDTSILTEKERDALLASRSLPLTLNLVILSEAERRTLLSSCQERCAAWKKILCLAKQIDDGKKDMNDIEFRALHYVLLLPGVLEKKPDGGIIETERIENETSKILRYLRHGFDLSPIEPRGPSIGKNWFAIGPTFGEHRAAEGLRNYIEASADDPDYWTALTVIVGRFIEEGQPLPDLLRSWFGDVNEGKRKAPPKTRGGTPYANEIRDEWICWARLVLQNLGMTGERTLSAISESKVINPDESRTPGRAGDEGRLSEEAIKTASRNSPPDVPHPWERGLSPREYVERRRKAKKKT